MSLFVTFEGGEGSGKSEQAMALHRHLFKLAVPAVLTHEPGVTSLGKKINYLVKWSDNVNVSPSAELLLFNASRAQLVEEVIKPSLADGKVVICDRFFDSTTAYQGYGRGLDLKMVRAVNLVGSQGMVPGLTVLLDLPAEEGLARKKSKKQDRFEKEELAFHEQVRQGYLQLARNEPKRFLVVDALLPKNTVASIIGDRVKRLVFKR